MNKVNINCGKINNTSYLLTQFGVTSSTLEATNAGRKFTMIILVQITTVNSQFTTCHLITTRDNFYIGTARYENPSHPPSITQPMITPVYQSKETNPIKQTNSVLKP
jgi:hypothetical protein